MTNKEKINYLNSLGCDTASAIERVLDDPDFYIECVQLFINDNNIEKIETLIEQGEYGCLFEEFHNLKGVVANLGLTTLYNIAFEITEMLRHNNYNGLKEKISVLLCHYNDILKIKE